MGKKLDVAGWVTGWRVGRNLSRLFHPHTADQLADFSAKGIVLLDNLREQAAKAGTDLKSVTADMIIAAIPGDWDAKLRDYVVNTVIPKVISGSIAVGQCLEEPTVEQEIVCLFNVVVPQKDENERTVFWNGIASLFAHEIGLFISGQPLDFMSILKAIPIIFEELFSKAKK